MQIILNQVEIEEAIKADVCSKIAIREDQELVVDIDGTGKDVTAYVSILSEGETATKVAKPKVTRAKKTKVTKETIVNEEPEEKQDEVEEGNTAEETGTAEEPTAAEETETTEPIKRTPMKIFTDIDSSAAPSAPEKEVDPAQAAKSLFANLGKDAA